MEEALEGMEMPDSPVNELDQAVIAWKTVYDKFSEQDFTNSQALYLTGCLLLGNPGMPPSR
jgi:hypothetical protein